MRVSDLADSNQVFVLQKRLYEADQNLARLVPRAGEAFQIIEHDSDMRKRALAKAMTPWLDAGESASAADAKGRASFNYEQDMARLSVALKAAYTTRLEWEAAKVHYESCRSLLSLEKELAGIT